MNMLKNFSKKFMTAQLQGELTQSRNIANKLLECDVTEGYIIYEDDKLIYKKNITFLKENGFLVQETVNNSQKKNNKNSDCVG